MSSLSFSLIRRAPIPVNQTYFEEIEDEWDPGEWDPAGHPIEEESEEIEDEFVTSLIKTGSYSCKSEELKKLSTPWQLICELASQLMAAVISR